MLEIVRDASFHAYPGPRELLVVSNLPFVVVALLARRARWYLRAGVAAIGIGSAGYHLAPGDELLALDWAPIVVTLMLLTAAVICDRFGRRAGRAAFTVGPPLALLAVAYWLATGGTTDGGNMLPYVVVQSVGVAVPPLLALIRPGRIDARWLAVGVAGFLLARAAAAYDRQLVDAIGFSGHSLKHVIAAAAAWCALRATYRPIQ